jgi:hypothetical protein
MLGVGLDQLEPEMELGVARARRLQLRGSHVDADDAARTAALEPGTDIRRPAAELDDVLAGDVGKDAQLGLGHAPDSPGDLLLRPVGARPGIRVGGVARGPRVAIDGDVPGKLGHGRRRYYGGSAANPYGSARKRTGRGTLAGVMTTIKAEDVRIPREVREALARHEEVVVLNRERPVYVILNPDDRRERGELALGRPLADALALMAAAPLPDDRFGEDMRAVLDAVGEMPDDPWAHS